MININYTEEERIRLEKYNNYLIYKHLNLSDEKIKELKDLYNNNIDEHKRVLNDLKYADEYQEQEKAYKKQKEYINAIRREKRKQKRDLKLHLEAQIKAREEKKRIANEKIKKSKKRYKDENCMSFQVFLEKDLVIEFKTKVKKSGISQAEVLRNFMKDYIKS